MSNKKHTKTIINEVLEEVEKISETQTPDGLCTFKGIGKLVEKYLPNSKVALKLALAVATSGTRKNQAMLWLLIVGVPSSGKTDLVRLLRTSESTFNIDNLTLNAFISGERPTAKQKVYDLLPKLDGKCLIIKDWTVIFSLDERMTKKIIGDMVGAYDKNLAKFSSRRGNVTYNSEFSHLGCITPATLNRHRTYLNMIGPRFLSYSMPQLTEKQDNKSFKAIFEGTDRNLQEEVVTESVSRYLDQLNQKELDIKPLSKGVVQYLKIASKFVAHARGIVIIQASRFKNEKGEDITYYEVLDMQIEKPWRAVQQLITLAKYLAFVSGKKRVGSKELEIIKDVVLSSMPADRAQAIKEIRKNSSGEISAITLANHIEKSTKTSRRLLDELTFLKVVKKKSGSGQMANKYSVVDEFKDFILKPPREFLSSYSNEREWEQSMIKKAGK